MKDPCAGFKDKLYWRWPSVVYLVRGQLPDHKAHCFKRQEDSRGGRKARCVSLCGKYVIPKSGGQASRRPEPFARCARCDGLEMERRGWEESGPTLEPIAARGRG